MWWIFIVIVVIVFVFFIYALNPDKFRSLFKRKPKQPKPEKVKEEKPKNPNFSYEEYKPVKNKDDGKDKKVDDQQKPKSSEVAYTSLKEEIAKEKLDKEEKKKSSRHTQNTRRIVKGGRKTGNVVASEIAPVEVEDLGEYNVDVEDVGIDELPELDDLNNEDIDDDFYEFNDIYERNNNPQSIGEEIKNLSPELKALLIDNVLNKKTDDDKN